MSNSTNHQERLMTVIVGPHLSEKTTIVAEELNQTVFKVRVDANKKEIKQAVEKLFEVKVEKVTTCLLYTSPSPRDQRGSRMPGSG